MAFEISEKSQRQPQKANKRKDPYKEGKVHINREKEKMFPPSEVRSVLNYNFETGELWWTENAKYRQGKKAGGISTGYKYRSIRKNINGKLYEYKLHRVVWCWVYGEWPEKYIDHINGDPTDNRIENLREVTTAENAKNYRRARTKSGVFGVYKRSHGWTASIRVNYKLIRIGSFRTKEEAVKARKDAERFYGFHKNHGAFVEE